MFPARTRSRLGAVLATAVLAALCAPGSALALDAPTGVSSSPTSPSNQQSAWTFTWNPVTPDPGGSITGYVGGVVAPGAADPASPIASGHATPIPEGLREFRVAAVQDVAGVVTTGPYATITLRADYTPPAFSIALSPSAPNGTNGWYRSLTIQRSCSDSGAGLAGACPSQTWTTDGSFAAALESVQDLAGNSTSATRLAFNFDGTLPNPDATSGQPLQPGTNALVGEEPAFTWTRGADATSGVARYEVQYKRAADPETGYVTIADEVSQPPVGDPTTRRDPALAGPLPERTPLQWRVRTYDRAGNVRTSAAQGLTIDSTIPAAPTITGGPSTPTRNSSPTFSWTGTEETYLWDLTLAGAQNATRRGGGPATQATIPNLPDGDYTFRVSQVTRAGRESAEATRAFKVDTTAPAAPTILVRPPFPAISAPVFTWATEPGAYSRWTALGEGGVTIVPPTDTPTVTAALPPLADGAYSFQVRQIDAAGNVSPPTVEPFTMLAPLAPAPSPSGGATAAAAALPRQNAKRLRPRAGARVPTRSPVLQWKRGPRGTRLYNLQIFRVIKRRGSSPKIRKVLSVFPRGLQMRAPKKRLRASTCYVWRVWPYTGRSFTPKPVGVSNFCVASAKVLKRKAAQARARKLAARRRAALAR